MSISSIDRGATFSPTRADSMTETTAAGSVGRGDNNLVRFLNQGDISEWVGGNRPASELPAPEIPEQLDDVVASATSAFNRFDANDMTTDLYSIMALMVQVYQSQRTADREVRQAGYQIQAADQYAAADKMRDAAQTRMWGSIAESATQMIGGVITAGGGAVGYTSIAPAAGQAIASVGGFIKAGTEYSAVGIDAQRMNLDTAGRTQEQMTQEVSERMSQLQDAIRDVLSKLSALEQSRTEINRGISRSL